MPAKGYKGKQKIRGVVTEDQIKNAYKLAREGKTICVICSMVGISYDSYNSYKKRLKKGEKINDDARQFIEGIYKGQNEFFAMCEDSVALGVSQDYRFALEVLSRRKKAWQRKANVIKNKIDIDLKSENNNYNISSDMTPEEALEIYKRMIN